MLTTKNTGLKTSFTMLYDWLSLEPIRYRYFIIKFLNVLVDLKSKGTETTFLQVILLHLCILVESTSSTVHKPIMKHDLLTVNHCMLALVPLVNIIFWTKSIFFENESHVYNDIIIRLEFFNGLIIWLTCTAQIFF